MNADFVKSWDRNKDKLENYFRTTPQSNYDSYKKLVIALLNKVINVDRDPDWNDFNTERIHVINDGDYQGTLVFLVPESRYQPDSYFYTKVWYGSCSVCDTLQSIQSENYEEYPTDSQVESYMTLCLHMLQQADII